MWAVRTERCRQQQQQQYKTTTKWKKNVNRRDQNDLILLSTIGMKRSHTYSTLTASESVLGQSTHTHSRTLFSSTLRYSVCIQFLCYVFSIRLSLSESQHFYVADMDKSNAQFILNGCTQVPIWIRKLVSKSFEQKKTFLSSIALARILFLLAAVVQTISHSSRFVLQVSFTLKSNNAESVSVDVKRFASSRRHQIFRYRPYSKRIDCKQIVHGTQIYRVA